MVQVITKDFKNSARIQLFMWSRPWSIPDQQKWKWLAFCMIGDIESCRLTVSEVPDQCSMILRKHLDGGVGLVEAEKEITIPGFHEFLRTV